MLVAQRPHIFYQCRSAVERAFGAERVGYVVDSRHLMDLEMMERSNLFGYPDGEFSAESLVMQTYAGGQERVVLLGKDALFPNAVEAALSLDAPERWRIFDSLDIKKCPRCTYQSHNQIYEHVIVKDSMTYKFI